MLPMIICSILGGSEIPDTAGNLNIEIVNRTYSCQHPSMIYDFEGNCVCPRGFSHDDPISERGCWLCIPPCGTGAYCEYPGRCECLAGYLKVDEYKCKVPMPFNAKLDRNRGRQLSYLKIGFEHDDNYIPKQFYCRFDDKVVEGKLINSTFAECLVPVVISKSFSESLKVSLSFDRINWGTQSYSFIVTNISSTFTAYSFIFGAVVFTVIAIIAFQRKSERDRRNLRDIDAETPLIVH